MRKNFGAKAFLYPMPVLIIGTYDENGKPNAMNIAFTEAYHDGDQASFLLYNNRREKFNIAF